MRRIKAAGLLALLPCVALLGACAGTDLTPVASLERREHDVALGLQRDQGER